MTISWTDAIDAPALSAEDVRRLRANFPFYRRGSSYIYLDSAATSQKPDSVLTVERNYSESRNAAVHRGAHTLAAEATEEFERARHTVAQFVGAHHQQVVWTENATAGINLLAYAFSNASTPQAAAKAHPFALTASDDILVTEMEHHANLIPWQELARRTGARLQWVPLTPTGELELDTLEQLLTERTRIFAFTHASNVLGFLNPVATLVERAQAVGALTVLDACQTVPHLPVNFPQLGVDFAVFSGHKMLGPTGIGVLYGRSELLDALPPFLTGGSMIASVTMERTTYMPAPQRFEAGTQPVSQAIALAEAVRYLEAVGMSRIASWEASLGQRLLRGLSHMPGVRVLGPGLGHERLGLVSFDVEGVHPHDVGQFLDEASIAVRVGHHCAQPLHRALGLTASTRASAYLYTTEEDVDAFLERVAGVRQYFLGSRQ